MAWLSLDMMVIWFIGFVVYLDFTIYLPTFLPYIQTVRPQAPSPPLLHCRSFTAAPSPPLLRRRSFTAAPSLPIGTCTAHDVRWGLRRCAGDQR